MWWFHLTTTLANGMGPAAAALGISGTLITLAHWRKGGWALALFPLFHYLLMGSSRVAFQRYMIPVLPFLSLMGAWLLLALLDRLPLARLFKGAVGFAVVTPLTRSVLHDLLLTRTDTRTLAWQWIERNIEPGTIVATQAYGPPIPAKDSPSVGGSKVREMKDRVKEALLQDRLVYEVRHIQGPEMHDVARLVAEGASYAVVNDYCARRHLAFRDIYPKEAAFYGELDKKASLAAEFSPYKGGALLHWDNTMDLKGLYSPAASELWLRERPGPQIRIYRLGR